MVKNKGKKSTASQNDIKVTTVVVVLGLAVAAFFLFFPKSKEPSGPKKVLPVIKQIRPKPLPVAVITPIAIKKMPQGSAGKIAIIIDDWGQSLGNCKYLEEISEPLAVSILPGLRHTKDVARCAGQSHKMTMLHLPLEALNNNDFYPQDYIIKTTMKPNLVLKILDEDLDQLPSIEGVNNHMGSKATEDKNLMKLIFRKLKKKKLFFVDSMTAHNSVCAQLAGEMDLAFSKRDVFLDNVNNREAIIKQLMLLAQKARHRGYAVAIGHDRHLTMQVLKEQIPVLEDQGFEIVSIKDLLKKR
ncbi:MAG: divergent polysaccharide deacetylase family protein [Candidatus Omnitrophica bacterium]|nr:divergent polysaccharide deacetylase family protein [Candidatus Omnitrophota bacterium]